MERRQFVKQAVYATASMCALSSFTWASVKKIGLQLYTLRDIIGNDVKGTLAKVASFGYKELEAYGYGDGKVFNMPYQEFAKLVKGLGMQITSGHYSLGKSPAFKDSKGTLLNDWERAVADAKEAGQEYMAVAYLNEDERSSLDDYKKVCEILNKGGEVCKKYGVRLNYHNHDFEFQKHNNLVAYDVMLNELDPKLVGMEVDLYWMYFANQNPLHYFEKYPGRFEQWHVKDMDKKMITKQVDVGTGRIDFKSIFAKAKQSGMKHFYIEQEEYPVSSIDSTQKSIINLKKIL